MNDDDSDSLRGAPRHRHTAFARDRVCASANCKRVLGLARKRRYDRAREYVTRQPPPVIEFHQTIRPGSLIPEGVPLKIFSGRGVSGSSRLRLFCLRGSEARRGGGRHAPSRAHSRYRELTVQLNFDFARFLSTGHSIRPESAYSSEIGQSGPLAGRLTLMWGRLPRTEELPFVPDIEACAALRATSILLTNWRALSAQVKVFARAKALSRRMDSAARQARCKSKSRTPASLWPMTSIGPGTGKGSDRQAAWPTPRSRHCRTYPCSSGKTQTSALA